jgi:methyl-accepting chemotaxis protein
MQPEERFAKIEALLQAMAERMVQAERRMDRADRRMEKAEQRMDRAEQRMEKFDERMDRAERRMEKFDQRIEVTRKLVQVGMKLVIQNNLQLKQLQRAQAAFLDSLRKGGGNGHRR